VPERARTVAELEPGTPVRVLPELLAITSTLQVARGELAAWSRKAASWVPGTGVPDAAWSLAAALEARGLSEEALGETSEKPVSLGAQEAVRWLEALEERARNGVPRTNVQE